MRYPLVDPGRRRRLAVGFNLQEKGFSDDEIAGGAAQDREMTTTTMDLPILITKVMISWDVLQEREVPHEDAHAQERRNDSRSRSSPRYQCR